MRNFISRFLLALAVFATAVPVWAHTDKTQLTLDQPARIQGKQLKPGRYQLVVNENDSRLRVMRNDKLVAQVQGQWVPLKKKSPDTEIVFNKNKIHEIRFAGRTEEIRFRE